MRTFGFSPDARVRTKRWPARQGKHHRQQDRSRPCSTQVRSPKMHLHILPSYRKLAFAIEKRMRKILLPVLAALLVCAIFCFTPAGKSNPGGEKKNSGIKWYTFSQRSEEHTSELQSDSFIFYD